MTLGNLVGGFIFTGLALYITHKPRTGAGAADRADAGAGGMSEAELKPAAETQAGDFEPEQKRYLEGFVAGLQIAKTAKGVAGAGAAPARRACARAGRSRCRRAARRRTACSQPAASCPTRRSSSARSIRSTPTSG